MMNKVLVIQAELMADGSCFIWVTDDQDNALPSDRWKNRVFMWHAMTFYGTILDEHLSEGRPVVILSPLEAADFLSRDLVPQLSGLVWSDSAGILRQTAKVFVDALRQGRVYPDYERWQPDEPAWRVEITDKTVSAAKDHMAWVSAIVADLTRRSPAVQASWEAVLEAHPALAEAPSGFRWIDDEQDWFEAVGYKTDGAPFIAGMQLIEPEDGEEAWTVRVVLQNRSGKEKRLFHVVNDADWTAEGAPGEWIPFLGELDRKRAQWVRMLPSMAEWTKVSSGWLLTEAMAWDFLTDGSIRLAESGVLVILPGWWETVKDLKPRLKAAVKSTLQPAQSMVGIDAILQYDWKVALGDVDVDEDVFRRAIAEQRRLIQVGNRWISLDPAFLKEIQKLIRQVEKKGLTLRDLLENQLGIMEREDDEAEEADISHVAQAIQFELNRHLEAWLNRLRSVDQVPQVPPPQGFQGSLRPYQQRGMSWLWYMRQFGLGVCLADDMGLGKTIQWIAYLQKVKEEEGLDTPALLICPTSVLGNWESELARFAPGLRVYLHYGQNRKKGESFIAATADYDLVITTYGLSHLDSESLNGREWSSIGLDEAQNIKNPLTKQARAIRHLRANHRIALTGTPIENRLTEMWSIMHFLNPGYLGSLGGFRNRFVNPIEKHNDETRIRQLQSLTRPFLLRRTKRDPAIIADLPDKQEMKVYSALNLEQAALYEQAIEEMFRRLEAATPMQRRSVIMTTLIRLKQICDHPALLLKESDTPQPERSQKVTRLLELVEELRSEGDGCLVFTQYVKMGEMLKHYLSTLLGEPVFFLHGGLNKGQRDDMIARFQAGESGVFILSLKAGGTGLNLTAANHVFHFDRWWNPAVENQATDRAFRIGQTRHVQVHKFVTRGTLEEKIDAMITRKQILAEQIISAGEGWITELSDDELTDLFTLRREWVEV